MPRLLGGALCLDFVNTVDPRHRERRREYLGRYEDVIAWGRHAGALSAEQHARLLHAAGGARPRVYTRAIALREALYTLLTPANVDASRREQALAELNDELARSSSMARLREDGDGFRWDWADDGALDRVLWPIVRSAAELLTSDALGRVRECPGIDGDCGWLFLDASKNETRRWCSMQACGNRAKARRHYARGRSAARRARRV